MDPLNTNPGFGESNSLHPAAWGPREPTFKLPAGSVIEFCWPCGRGSGWLSRMKNVFLVALAAVALVFSTGCHLAESYKKNESARVSYLQDKKVAPAKINVEGVWYSSDWGILVLKQHPGGKLTGMSSGWMNVDGVVSGNKVYLTFVDSGWTEYTVELKRPQWDRLSGLYSAHVPFSEIDQEEVVLERIRR